MHVRTTAAAVLLTALVLMPAAARADTTIDGPIGLGTAEAFSVLGGSTVTNTGASVLSGDLGLSPGSSITGFPPGILGGTVHATDEVAALAQEDLTTAYGVAASLTPTATGLGDLTGSSLTPGVYAGGELSLAGELVLAGTAESVWVFQAASTLTIGTGAVVTLTGGASACNVFWQVGSSATIGSGALFVGTVMADTSITAGTEATVTGRLLARTGAVTLDTNTLIAPTGCAATAGTVTTSPEITSEAPPAGQVGEDYAHTITAEGTPSPTFTVSGGALPPGITLDEASGVLSGQPTQSGSYAFEITASNSGAPDAVESYTLTVEAAASPSPSPTDTAPAAVPDADTDTYLEAAAADAVPVLAESGSRPDPVALVAAILLAAGVSLVCASRIRRRVS